MNDYDSPFDAQTLAALAAALAPARLAPERRAALRERVLAGAVPRAAGAELMQVVRAEEGTWLPLLPGVAIKFLRLDPATRSQTSLWRLDPGASIPSHPHDAEEECIILDGAVRFGGRDYARGDFLLARPGLMHERFDTSGGALLYIRSELTAHLAGLAQRAGLL